MINGVRFGELVPINFNYTRGREQAQEETARKVADLLARNLRENKVEAEAVVSRQMGPSVLMGEDLTKLRFWRAVEKTVAEVADRARISGSWQNIQPDAGKASSELMDFARRFSVAQMPLYAQAKQEQQNALTSAKVGGNLDFNMKRGPSVLI